MLRLVFDELDFGSMWCPGLSQFDCEPMSTAIVRIYTPEGFVLAADGFSTENDLGAEQKIFPATNSPSWTLAYGLSEKARAFFHHDETGVDVIVDFAEECKLTAKRMNSRHPRDLNDYAKTFTRLLGDQIFEQITEAKNHGKIMEEDYSKFMESPRNTTLQFAGYFEGDPAIATTELYFSRPEPYVRLVQPTTQNFDRFHDCWGSKVVLGVLSSKDSDFTGKFVTAEEVQAASHIASRYRTPEFVKFLTTERLSLDEGVGAAKTYIEACSDLEAPKIDVKCKFIGGRRHIAKITRSDGFVWIEPPAPKPDAR
jgi:hypothetical protein